MFVLFVFAVLLDFCHSALIPLTKGEDSVRSCMNRIIEVYAEDPTTVLSLYTNETKRNFLPYPIKIPIININANGMVYNFNYQTRKESLIIDFARINFNKMEKLGLWSDVNLLNRKFVFTLPIDAYTQVQKAFKYLWHFDIRDAIDLVYDYSFRILLDLGDSALIPLTKGEDSVRSCMKRIIEVYADDSTTVFSFYTNETKGNFLPYPMKIAVININANGMVHNFNYKTRKELVIIDLVNVNFNKMEKLGLWSHVNLLKRKFVFTWPLDAYTQVQNTFSYLWHFDIPDAIVLVYDYSLRSNFTEVFISNRLHPSNRCGALVKNMSRFSCNMINKTWKQQFFRNYNKCRVTYCYGLSETVNNKKNYITEIVLSEIVSTLNLTFFKKPKSINVAANDNYLLSSTNMRSCILKSMFCGVTFMEDVLVWTIPSPKKLDSLEVFKLIFKWNSWILIFLSSFLRLLCGGQFLAAKSLTGSSAVLNVYSLTLMVAIPTVPKCFPLRCLFVTYVIYAIHIQTGFTSNLVNLLTVPQYSVIKTIEELVDTNLPILIPHRSANILLNMTHEGNQIFEKMKKNIMVLPDKEWSRSMQNLQLLENSSIMTSTDNVRVMVNSLKKKVHFLMDMDQTLVKMNYIHLPQDKGPA
ncbi:hypothetical protein FQA39_LY05590 [Lamprigera yunnana]|nr:hypothetical protein FQA39_LY05590 [Lamprigera yunnana]